MRPNLALVFLLLGLVVIMLSTGVDAKKCKGKGCSKKHGEGKTQIGRLKGRKVGNKGKGKKRAAPYWRKGPPKTSEIIVREETDLTLTCAIKGKPSPKFSWLINGKLFVKKKSKKIRQRRHRLVIKDIQVDATGSYTCIANNSLGQLNFTYNVRVLENMPLNDIHVIDQPENQTAQVGDTAIFLCRSQDWPTPKVHWSRRTVASNVLEIVKMPDNTTDSSVLVLHNVTKKDSGEYICFIRSGVIKKELSATLTVIDESESLPFEPPCSLHVRRQTLSDHTRTCKTPEPVEMHYCMGSCGRSYYIPQLIMSDDSSAFHLNQTCKCCVGVVERLKIVQLNCPLGQIKRGFYTLLRECQCQSCNTEDKIPSTSTASDSP